MALRGCGIFNRRQNFYHLFDVPVFQGEQLSQPPVVIGEPHGYHLVPGVLDGPGPSRVVGLMLDSRGGLVGVLVAAGREGRGGLVGVVAAGRCPPVVRRSAGVKAGPAGFIFGHFFVVSWPLLHTSTMSQRR